MVTDPVCGIQIEEEPAAGSSTYGGQRYYFCSGSCRDKFVANPAGYLKKTGLMTPPKHAKEKGARNYPYMIWSSLALLTCPCCIPIWVFLLSGTVAGALLTKNIYLTVAAFLVPFLFFAWRALRSYGQKKIPG